MAPTKRTTKVLLMAVAITGLVFAGFASTTIAHDPNQKAPGDFTHSLSRTFPGEEARVVICSQTVAELLGIGGPKDPGQPDCDQNNPNWLFAVRQKATSGYYYERERIHEKAANDAQVPSPIGVDPKLGLRAGKTSISQSAIFCYYPATVDGNDLSSLGLIIAPNDCHVSADNVKWVLSYCQANQATFNKGGAISPGTFTFSPTATTIQCGFNNDQWGETVNVTKYLENFGTSVSTGFWEPTVEGVAQAMAGANPKLNKANGLPNSYLGSVLVITDMDEVDPATATTKTVHTDDKTPGLTDGGDSFITSHDWFMVLTPEDADGSISGWNWATAIQNNVVYDLGGSDAQAENRMPFYGDGVEPGKK